VLLAGVAISLATRRTRTARRAAITKIWARLLLRALGIRVKTTAGVAFPALSHRTALEEGAGALLVANHVSWLDPLIMAAMLPSRLLAKREIGEWPLIRTLVAGSGALFIDRERLSRLPSAVATVAGALRAGDTVVAFPEGTTWCGREMGRFRPAVFQAAIDAGAAVYPATLRYCEGESTSARGCYVGDDSLIASLLRVVATRGLTVEVSFFAPIRLTATGRRHETRAALARIAEAQVRTGIHMPAHPATRAAASPGERHFVRSAA
jgi:1-acyl-sn-glycerol-3-phosphate acyltransferase